MFKYVKLKNYKSLLDFSVNLVGKGNRPKKFILVYGENGVGKSNFVSAFLTLCETMRTKSTKEMLDSLVENMSEDDDIPIKFLRDNLKDIETIIQSCKTINSKENLVMEFGFQINGKNGVYRIEMNDKNIVAENLKFVWNKNISLFYEIDEEKVNLNSNIFLDREYEFEARSLLEKFWGRHSFLSLLVWDLKDKKEGYVQSRICNGLYEVISYFMTISLRVKEGYGIERGKMGIAHEILANLEQGEIESKSEHELRKAEEFLNTFFTQLYSDIKQVYYKKKDVDGNIEYSLFFKKLMYNQIVDVDFKQESTGTQYLLEMIPHFMACVEGQTVVIDEMDSGIHDLLVANILENLYDSIQEQIIITTHNTMLLETDIPKECVYVFNVDEDARKCLIPLSEFEERIHPNLNIRKRYLNGMYGGIPMSMDIDFDELLDIMD